MPEDIATPIKQAGGKPKRLHVKDLLPPMPKKTSQAIEAPQEVENAFRPFKPNAHQIKLVEFLYRRDPKQKPSYRQMAKEINVDVQVIYDWFADTGFLLWLKRVRQVQFSAWRPIVDGLLMKNVYQGKRWAFELFYELGGDMKRTIEERALMIDNFSSMDVHQKFALFQERLQTIRGTIEPPQETNRSLPPADSQGSGIADSRDPHPSSTSSEDGSATESAEVSESGEQLPIPRD